MDETEIVVRLIDLPTRVRGLVALDEEGTANVYINARLSETQRHRALCHELRHVRRGDFTSEAGIRGVEE